jgi:hypothetical protein
MKSTQCSRWSLVVWARAGGQDALEARGAGERAGREARLEELPSIVPSVHGEPPRTDPDQGSCEREKERASRNAREATAARTNSAGHRGGRSGRRRHIQ